MQTPATFTVMLVEDDFPLMNVYIRKLQENENIRFLCAWDGEQAIDILSRVQPDLMITGLNMPKMDGFELMEHIQQKGYQFPIIVVTNVNNKETRALTMKLGATEYYVKKDITMKDLIVVIQKYLQP